MPPPTHPPRPVGPPAVPVAPPAGTAPARPQHLPVLLVPAVSALLQNAPPGAVFVDATFGAGGHAAEILRRLPPSASLLALDCDETAADRARLFADDPRFRFARRNFADLAAVLRERAVPQIHGALFDLGVSSMQLDSPERGFSFRSDAPPDMRMDRRAGPTAAQWIRAADRGEMERAFREYGEEPEARRVARALCENRAAATSAAKLAEAIKRAKRIPSRPGHHPATRVFQALRIAVNRELESLRRGLDAAFQALADGGRLVVIAFHSLEDRVVKRFAAGETLPDIGQSVARRFVLAEKPRVPDADETANNPRARSARMRTMIKIGTGESESVSGPRSGNGFENESPSGNESGNGFASGSVFGPGKGDAK